VILKPPSPDLYEPNPVNILEEQQFLRWFGQGMRLYMDCTKFSVLIQISTNHDQGFLDHDAGRALRRSGTGCSSPLLASPRTFPVLDRTNWKSYLQFADMYVILQN
jgi:hypothetical protein